MFSRIYILLYVPSVKVRSCRQRGEENPFFNRENQDLSLGWVRGVGLVGRDDLQGSLAVNIDGRRFLDF